jgi:hypothetical protein
LKGYGNSGFSSGLTERKARAMAGTGLAFVVGIDKDKNPLLRAVWMTGFLLLSRSIR